MALSHKPAVQVRAVRRVANAECPVVTVPALDRADDRARADPRPERLGCAGTTPIALAGRPPAGLRRFGSINALESHLLPSHFKRIRVNDSWRAAPDLNGDFAGTVRRRLGVSSWRLHGLARAGWLPMTMPFSFDLALLGTIGPAIVTPVGREAARMRSGRAGREGHDQCQHRANTHECVLLSPGQAIICAALHIHGWEASGTADNLG